MNRKTLLKVWISGFLLFLAVVLAACAGPPGPQGPPGPPGKPGPAAPPASGVAQYGPSLATVPTVAMAGKTVTFVASGVDPKEEVRIWVASVPEVDVTLNCEPVPKVNAGGAFDATFSLQDFPPGLYTVSLLGKGGNVLATAPLKVEKAK